MNARPMLRAGRAFVGLALLWVAGCTPSRGAQVTPRGAELRVATTSAARAAYFYYYMDFDHIDSLAAAGFNRALVKWTVDSLDAGGRRARGWFERGQRLGVEVWPVWTAQAVQRLDALPTARRYTWGDNVVERPIGCPLDSLFWRSALLDRAEEFLDAVPSARRLAVDLEIYSGGPGHYDAGPCRCRACLAEFDERRRAGQAATKLIEDQTGRLEQIFTRLLVELHSRHPGLELGVFDLDFDSFVHEALGRALTAAGIPAVNYSEKTYTRGAQALPVVRKNMLAKGLAVPVVGGLWLKQFAPEELVTAGRELLVEADGYFVFTTYSLWKPQSELHGPYTLPDPQSHFWSALREVNR